MNPNQPNNNQNQQPANPSPEFMHQNMQTGQISAQLNHGGHEMFDVHEVLSGTVGALNLYTLCQGHVQDQELKAMLSRHYQHITKEYNACVQAFQTGKDPAMRTESYKMAQDNDFVYGLKPAQPVKPIQSVTELNDQCVSALLLGTLKSNASSRGMATLEVTNPVLRRVLADGIPNWIEMAYELSIWQNKNHYYQVPQLNQQDMTSMMNAYAPAPQSQLPLQ
ncbi:spore coat protein F-like protein YhcQ [Fictibacillus barbaricus]|nr:spore coat protein F-like protein YhcQ [Fictibacillus barbaricus]